VQNAVSEQTNLLWSEILSMKMEINRLKYALEQQQPAKNQIVTYTKPGYDENMIHLRNPVFQIDTVGAGGAKIDDVSEAKKRSKIIASLPEPSSTNPIAALINFGKHQLLIDVEFRHIETRDLNTHLVEIYFLDQLMGTGEDRRKKVAREIAAREVLIKLNKEHQLLDRFIDLALSQQAQ
jgi:hypothetical protein